jgi:hypothetical protein
MNTQFEDIQFELEKYRRVFQNQIKPSDEQEGNSTDKKIDLNYLFSDKYGVKIAEFLDYSDVLNLTYLNKFINKAIHGRTDYFILLTKGLKRQFQLTQRDLKKRLSKKILTTIIS